MGLDLHTNALHFSGAFSRHPPAPTQWRGRDGAGIPSYRRMAAQRAEGALVHAGPEGVRPSSPRGECQTLPRSSEGPGTGIGMIEWPWVSRSFFHISFWPHGMTLPSPVHPPPAMGRALIPELQSPGPCPQPGKKVGGPVPETTASPEPLLPLCSPCCPKMPSLGETTRKECEPRTPSPYIHLTPRSPYQPPKCRHFSSLVLCLCWRGLLLPACPLPSVACARAMGG